MLFSIVYSIDTPRCCGFEHLRRQFPPNRRNWQQTEGDEQYEAPDLGEDWDTGYHRKFATILTRKQFENFVQHCRLYAQDIGTGGTFGAPGFGCGWAPAISFDSRDSDVIKNAYVTPLPAKPNGKPIRKNSANDRDWKRIRRVVINQFCDP